MLNAFGEIQIPSLSTPVFKGDLKLKNVCLRFSFWVHILLSGVSVIIMAMKLAYGPVQHGYIKITSKGMDVEVLVKLQTEVFKVIECRSD